MFQIGDQVVYGLHGVCQIAELEERIIDRKPVQYFVLEPLGHSGSRFLVPAQNPAALAKLRPVLTVEALKALLSSEEICSDVWIPDENLRKQQYRILIGSGDRAALLRMVYSLRCQKQLQQAAGKNSICAMKAFCGMRKSCCRESSLWYWALHRNKSMPTFVL